MRDISIAMPVSYTTPQYIPLIRELNINERLCRAYGIGFPHSYHITDEPTQRMILTKIPSWFASFIVQPMSRLLLYPKYYGYWSRLKLFDILFERKIAADESEILLPGMLPRTIRAAKRAGKKIVMICGNSEPVREYSRIMNDYERFAIKQKYIYGNKSYCDEVAECLSVADYLISISKVSFQTFLDAGYDEKKFTLIPLTGSRFDVAAKAEIYGKQKAFISTAHHNFIKGTQHLLLAWKKANITSIPLLVVGPICEDIKEFIRRYGPFPNVVFSGFKNNLREFYRSFDAVGILMSLSEGAVRTTPEMMAFGFPMVVSPDATCDLVEDGKNGYIVDSYDEDSLAARLNWFAEDWERVHAMRAAVVASVARRTMEDWSLEVAQFLMSIHCG